MKIPPVALDVLYRRDKRIHRWNCRFVTPNFKEWNYWPKHAERVESLQELIATEAPWLEACKVCKPTGWTE